MENFTGNEGERFGKRAAEKIGGAVEVAGQKLDAAVDYVESAKQSAKQTLDQACQDGWKGMKEKVMEYTRTEPLSALLIAAGTGLLFGWLTKRSRG
jgi:ElaB/YqjD/DUF883 family membrane-anchored ribosome-binding protein